MFLPGGMQGEGKVSRGLGYGEGVRPSPEIQKRAVRILLECLLVFVFFNKKYTAYLVLLCQPSHLQDSRRHYPNYGIPFSVPFLKNNNRSITPK